MVVSTSSTTILLLLGQPHERERRAELPTRTNVREAPVFLKFFYFDKFTDFVILTSKVNRNRLKLFKEIEVFYGF